MSCLVKAVLRPSHKYGAMFITDICNNSSTSLDAALVPSGSSHVHGRAEFSAQFSLHSNRVVTSSRKLLTLRSRLILCSTLGTVYSIFHLEYRLHSQSGTQAWCGCLLRSFTAVITASSRLHQSIMSKICRVYALLRCLQSY